MSTVQVVFQVLKGTRRFIIEKGRRWSVVEHLLLDAVSRGPATAADLAVASHLPRRVIVEAFIRLMRAGWIEVVVTTKGSVFQITPAGADRVDQEQLPAATVTEPRWRSFAIEPITGTVFRGRELDLVHKNRLPAGTAELPVVHINNAPGYAVDDLSEVFGAIEGEDEFIVGVDRGVEKLAERYAVVAVRDGVIEGLPGRASPLLRLLVGKAAGAVKEETGRNETAKAAIDGPTVLASASADEVDAPQMMDAAFDSSDVVIDGAEHARAFERMVTGAGERLIIHSTFLSDERAQAVLPLLIKAAERGVRVDILWGQDDIGTATRSSQIVAAKLQAQVVNAGWESSIRVHPFSTNSHAKVVVADTPKGGGWHALVGSCNWLASDFASFEASMRLRDPCLVGTLTRKLGGLAQGRPGVWNDLAVELSVLGRRIMERPSVGGRKVPMRLLYGSEHARLVLEARDKARERLFVLSHRIGLAAHPVALLPALAAVEANGIVASFYYGRTTGPLSGAASADLVREFGKKGLDIVPIHRPRLHAKVMGWDRDALAISSLNWLSADPSEAAPYREIGVLVEAPNVADNFLTRFESARVA
jgi:phosphatidylserine/phosphatidylglycerophosphate/cardiolipin synthase-like enzyme